MPAKRPGPASHQAAPKKRKPNKQTWYAVKFGLHPGVYETWEECSNNTERESRATYKSFTSKEDAEAFVAEPNPTWFYAVARGNFRGIFLDYDEFTRAITRAKNRSFKKFDKLDKAVEFMKKFSDKATNADIKVQMKLGFLSDELDLDPDLLHAYTDGSCLHNGTVDAVAGVGLFLGPDDPRNVSEPLEGELQTNQRAELTAILRALEKTDVTEGLQILSDSKYSINCAVVWVEQWESDGWKNSEGAYIKNKDLVQAIRKRMLERQAASTQTRYTWVRGHSKIQGNEEADKLAVNAALKKQAERIKMRNKS
ncbi:hypothetical protein CGLO_02979 [Colletotrichum gloeosporioides Cg-14]|uniref:Ribonuclease H n=1 Tax=Colletotrichum gloeosporioides (strain Cg-14) TaxID=1237896 RepID=T0KXR8_COLGC|nr:hypothetical protein CGLO_02979 [Colletotrichum gloeosporioides Cg-14]